MAAQQVSIPWIEPYMYSNSEEMVGTEKRNAPTWKPETVLMITAKKKNTVKTERP